MAPFRGVRYARDKVSGLAEVTSPPYDVIAHDIEDQLIAADPHNVVRLILPRHAPGHDGNVYDDAARTLREWQDEQILRPDPEPSLYVYEQAVPGPQGNGGEEAPAVLQRGLIGALRLSPLEAGIVRPHEDVAPGPVAGRLQLMEATQANLEPIFLLYDGSARGAAARIVDETAAGRRPLVDTVTSDGIRHRLWAIADPGELAAIAADLAPRSALIADGHHRYSAYLKLQARSRAAGDGPGPWDYGLALLVDASAYPPEIGAIHRVIPGLAPAAAAELAKAAFTVQRLPGGTPHPRPPPRPSPLPLHCPPPWTSSRRRAATARRSWSRAAARSACSPTPTRSRSTRPCRPAARRSGAPSPPRSCRSC